MRKSSGGRAEIRWESGQYSRKHRLRTLNFRTEPTTKEIKPSPAAAANRPRPAATNLTCPAIASSVDSPQSR